MHRFLPWLLLLGSSCAGAQGTAASEDDLRAAMVQHLTAFVEWPPSKLDTAHPDFTVCLWRADGVRPALESAFRNHTVAGKPVTLQRLGPEDKVDGCHLLYFGSAGRKGLVRLLPTLQEASVLTISESRDVQGQVISLSTEDDHIVIQVDMRAAAASRLTLSSRLLHLATLVNKQ